MSRISVIYVGVSLLLLGYVGPQLFSSILPVGWQQYFWYISGLGMLLIAAEVLVRLFSPSPKSSGVNNSSAALSTLDVEKDFRFWRNTLIGGFFFWFPAFVAAIMASDSGRQTFFSYAILYLTLLALPIAIICLTVAYNIRKTNVDRAVYTLKLPFYYGVGVLIFVLIMMWL